MPAYGKHNIANALAVVGVTHQLGLDMNDIADHLLTFSGVKRRFTEKKLAKQSLLMISPIILPKSKQRLMQRVKNIQIVKL